MFIRPYTISQTAILLLTLLLYIYLIAAVRRTPQEEHTHTRWMIRGISFGLVVIVVTMIVAITENTHVNLIIYFRDTFGLLFWYAIAQAIYALPPSEPFARWQEARLYTRLTIVLIVLEVCYLGYRLWVFSQTGTLQERIPIARLPLVILGICDVLLILRKLWAAERPPFGSIGGTVGQHLRRAFLAPQSDIGRFYRGFLFVVFGILGINVLFSLIGGGSKVISPTWLLISSDLVMTGVILMALFAYLSSSLAPSGLEIRVMGAGLTIFLGLISVLGWIITLTFLSQQAPNIAPVQIFGTQMQAQLFVTQSEYRDIASRLSDLLRPLIWFALLGSLFFLAIYTLYYRSTLKSSLSQIINGFGQVQQGNLAYRIPSITWQDEFSSIGTSFNQMTAALEQSGKELRNYQQHLQTLVDQRTAELSQEMELRKRLELNQGIQDERTRIAQETHDGLLQTLMGVRIRLNRGKRLSRLEAVAIEAELSELTGEIAQSIQDLRNLINELNEKILPDGLLTALEQIIERQQRTYSIVVHTSFVYLPGLLALNQELNIMRIVQEALTNAIRHGGATEVWLTMDYEHAKGMPVQMCVQIRDNGDGFDTNGPEGTGWGLKNMQRRATQLAATLHIQSQPGVETVVDLHIPLK